MTSVLGDIRALDLGAVIVGPFMGLAAHCYRILRHNACTRTCTMTIACAFGRRRGGWCGT